MQVNFEDVPLLEFGNKYHFVGVIMQPNSDTDASLLVMLPNQQPSPVAMQMQMSQSQWETLMNQLDTCAVEAIASDGEKVILRKSQRVIDNHVMWQVFRRDKFKCRYCAIDNVPLTVDHILTWEAGGASVAENLLTCCRNCNKKRGNMAFHDWLDTKYCRTKMAKYLKNSEVRKLNDIEPLKMPRLRNRRSR